MIQLLKWTGTLLAIVAAVLTVAGVQPYNFWAFVIGAVAWAWVSWKTRETSLLILNLMLLAIYSYGTVKDSL